MKRVINMTKTVCYSGYCFEQKQSEENRNYLKKYTDVYLLAIAIALIAFAIIAGTDQLTLEELNSLVNLP